MPKAKTTSRSKKDSSVSSKKVEKKPRYYGLTKVKKGAKLCWVAKEDKNGFAIGLGLASRTVWLTGLRIATVEEVNRVLGCSVVFVHTRNSKTIPDKLQE